MKRTVCYLVTRALYKDILPSVKSLLRNGNIDRVFILAEDRDIGINFPTRANVIVSDITPWRNELLDPDGPNYNCRWTWMVMMKAALCKMFQDDSRILSMDVDTIVRGDLSPLWEMDLTDYYFAGAREPYWTDRFHRDYVNAGVLMWNLDKMREGAADRVLKAMNRKPYTFVEQDCINELCWDGIRVIDSEWNAGDWTEQVKGEVKIRHYMASKGKWKQEPEVMMYQIMDWREVFEP